MDNPSLHPHSIVITQKRSFSIDPYTKPLCKSDICEKFIPSSRICKKKCMPPFEISKNWMPPANLPPPMFNSCHNRDAQSALKFELQLSHLINFLFLALVLTKMSLFIQFIFAHFQNSNEGGS